MVSKFDIREFPVMLVIYMLVWPYNEPPCQLLLTTSATLVRMNRGGLAGSLVQGTQITFGQGQVIFSAWRVPAYIAARIERVFPNLLTCLAM